MNGSRRRLTRGRVTDVAYVMTEQRHSIVTVASEAIRVFVEEQRELDPFAERGTELLRATPSSGVFVCLKRGGELRGCIGTTEPTKPTLLEEVISNAIAAATRDPRFPPVQAFELAELLISVDVLSSPEPVTDFTLLDHRRYGVMARAGGKHGVLLPDIEGIQSVEEQLTLVRQKAGLAEEEVAEFFRFEVTRYL